MGSACLTNQGAMIAMDSAHLWRVPSCSTKTTQRSSTPCRASASRGSGHGPEVIVVSEPSGCGTSTCPFRLGLGLRVSLAERPLIPSSACLICSTKPRTTKAPLQMLVPQACSHTCVHQPKNQARVLHYRILRRLGGCEWNVMWQLCTESLESIALNSDALVGTCIPGLCQGKNSTAFIPALRRVRTTSSWQPFSISSNCVKPDQSYRLSLVRMALVCRH